jgi:hypothetical protein
MSPSELIEAGERLFGPHWRQPFAKSLGVDVSTVRRWATAQTAISRSVALAIELLVSKTDRTESE